MLFKIGVDVGGTFTDFLLMGENGAAEVYKVLSTPDDPSVAVLAGFQEMASHHGLNLPSFLTRVEIIVHGTTVTTNAVLTGKISPTGLLTTRGFRDALQMRRGVREELYNNKYRPPKPLVPRDLRFPVTERVDHTGALVVPLDPADVEAGLALFKQRGIQAVAICFMHAYANSTHEEAAAARVHEVLPEAYLSVSTRILPQVRFYERVSTTVLNSSVGPILTHYLASLTRKLGDIGFTGILLIMQSNGGVTTPGVVMDLAASTLLSGPAAAPSAGSAYTAPHSIQSFITIDMGGTSFDTALIKDGVPALTTSSQVNRMALALPMMEINTIGAGGGSVAWIDEGGLLRMGPQSAGAKPGPVCYGLGGVEPTCSDANLVLGYLNADYFAGGRMKLDHSSARKAIEEKIARPLGLDVTRAAYGMYHIINVNMSSAIREISVQRGYDPRDFPMVCAGGAGPIHAAMIAHELEIPKIIIPKESSIFCAAGMLLSDLKHDFVRTYHTLLGSAAMDVGLFERLVVEMEDEGRRVLWSENISDERQQSRYSLDLRYLGQFHEVTVELPRTHLLPYDEHAIKERFHEAHDRLYGYSLKQEGTPVELVNLRLSATGATDKPVFQREAYQGPDPSPWRKGQREIYLTSEDAFVPVDVYDGDRMGFGNRLKGPAILEQVNTTTLVPTGWEVECDSFGSFLLTATM
jgi:N-methylhydantoinase A